MKRFVFQLGEFELGRAHMSSCRAADTDYAKDIGIV